VKEMEDRRANLSSNARNNPAVGPEIVCMLTVDHSIWKCQMTLIRTKIVFSTSKDHVLALSFVQIDLYCRYMQIQKRNWEAFFNLLSAASYKLTCETKMRI